MTYSIQKIYKLVPLNPLDETLSFYEEEDNIYISDEHDCETQIPKAGLRKLIETLTLFLPNDTPQKEESKVKPTAKPKVNHKKSVTKKSSKKFGRHS